MPRSPRVTNVFHYVADLSRTEAFYRDAMGLEVVREDGGDHGDFLIARTASGLDLLFFVGEPRPGNSPVLVFEIEEAPIEEVLEGLLARGAPLVTPLAPAPGGRSADVADPDGYTLSLYQADPEG